MAKKLPEKVYQLHISLKRSKPKIWRRFLVTEATTLGDLHEIIQAVMGWDNYHLHEFKIGGIDYGEPSEDFDYTHVIDESKVKLAGLDLTEKQKFGYVYDFGDDWEHEIKVEKILPFDPSIKYPKCLDGKLACPPEDCGGIWGFEEFVELSKKPEEDLDEDELERLEWLDDYDSEHFSVDEVNTVLWRRFAK